MSDNDEEQIIADDTSQTSHEFGTVVETDETTEIETDIVPSEEKEEKNSMTSVPAANGYTGDQFRTRQDRPLTESPTGEDTVVIEDVNDGDRGRNNPSQLHSETQRDVAGRRIDADEQDTTVEIVLGVRSSHARDAEAKETEVVHPTDQWPRSRRIRQVLERNRADEWGLSVRDQIDASHDPDWPTFLQTVDENARVEAKNQIQWYLSHLRGRQEANAERIRATNAATGNAANNRSDQSSTEWLAETLSRHCRIDEEQQPQRSTSRVTNQTIEGLSSVAAGEEDDVGASPRDEQVRRPSVAHIDRPFAGPQSIRYERPPAGPPHSRPADDVRPPVYRSTAVRATTGVDRRDAVQHIDPAQRPVAPAEEVIMAESNSIGPKPFKGTLKENIDAFLFSLDRWVEYRGLDDNRKLALAKVLLQEGAGAWLANLDVRKQDTYERLKKELLERFGRSKIIRHKTARELFARKQKPLEDVDTFCQEMIRLARAFQDEYEGLAMVAILGGLRVEIATFCAQRQPENLTELIELARLCEMTAAPSEVKDLSENIADLKDMKDQFQQLMVSVGKAVGVREISPARANRTVRFQDEQNDGSTGRRGVGGGGGGNDGDGDGGEWTRRQQPINQPNVQPATRQTYDNYQNTGGRRQYRGSDNRTTTDQGSRQGRNYETPSYNRAQQSATQQQNSQRQYRAEYPSQDRRMVPCLNCALFHQDPNACRARGSVCYACRGYDHYARSSACPQQGASQRSNYQSQGGQNYGRNTEQRPSAWNRRREQGQVSSLSDYENQQQQM
jgi:hypothetical protein